MSIRDKLDSRRIMNGALILGAIALAWAAERPRKILRPTMDTYPAGWAVDPEPERLPRRLLGMRWPWWRDVLMETYAEMAKDRLLAVAAGVVFYALLAIFPAVTAFVSSYGLFAKTGTIQEHLSLLSYVMPAGGISIVEEQIKRIADQPSGLSVGFAFGLAIALWSANAGVKALMDALNVIVEQDERRSLLRLNLLSLTMTLGAIVFLLLAVGAVVAFPLVMSTFGLKDYTATTTG
jgi:membrane protein